MIMSTPLLYRWWILAAVLLATLVGTLPSQAQSAKRDEDLDSLLSWMDGDFSSERQARFDTTYLHIELHMKRIWVDRTDGGWFYVEQALASRPDAPYRQRVYHVNRVEEGMFESVIYELPDPNGAIGAWQNPDLLDNLSPEELQLRRGCEVYLQATGESFIGRTHGTACRSDLQGASYATTEVEIRAQGMLSWDRGWSAIDEQVWGATKGGYVFLRK